MANYSSRYGTEHSITGNSRMRFFISHYSYLTLKPNLDFICNKKKYGPPQPHLAAVSISYLSQWCGFVLTSVASSKSWCSKYTIKINFGKNSSENVIFSKCSLANFFCHEKNPWTLPTCWRWQGPQWRRYHERPWPGAASGVRYPS